MKYIASGAKGFTITVKSKSVAYLPDILDLKDKTIKYIDLCNCITTEDRNGNIIDSIYNDCYMNLIEKGTQNLFIKGVNIADFDVFRRNGVRDYIGKKVDFVNSYISNESNYDFNLFFVIWYDEPQVMRPIYDNQQTNVDYVEIKQFSQTDKRMYFGENRTLLNKEITNFTFADDETITPSNYRSVISGVCGKSFLTLQKNNFMFIENVPIMLFYKGYYSRITLQNVQFDFQNSYIDVPQSVVNDLNGRCYFANVEYRRE